jgi:hypothetical protein
VRLLIPESSFIPPPGEMQFRLVWPKCLQLPQVGTFEDFTFNVQVVRAISDKVEDFSVAAGRVCSLSR